MNEGEEMGFVVLGEKELCIVVEGVDVTGAVTAGFDVDKVAGLIISDFVKEGEIFIGERDECFDVFDPKSFSWILG